MARCNRNGKIEFLRFIFSVIIVIHHSRYVLGDANCKFLGGSFAVEFFFLVSGYLMMASIEKLSTRKAPGQGLGKETLGFLWKKAKAVYPELLIAWIIALIFTANAQKKSILGWVALAVDSFYELTLLKMSGLYSTSLNGVTWYISSMLLCMAILYPLTRKYPDMMKRLGFPLIAVFAMGYLSGEFSNPRDPVKWIGFTMKGNIRALGEISLGAVLCVLVKMVENVKLTKLGKIMVTLAEWSAYILLVLYMYHAKAGQRDYFFLLVMAVAVGISFSHKGIDADMFDNPICVWLGKWSLPLYLGHTFYAYHLNEVAPKSMTGDQKMAVYMTLAIVTSFAIWGLSVLVKKITPRIAHILNSLLIDRSDN